MSEGNDQITKKEAIESLRCILERQQSRRVRYEEAEEVADSLIDFFELLAFEELSP